MPTSDVLILAVARQPGGLTIAGMTTERDPTTGLRWVRPTLGGGPWQLDALKYDDGTLVRPGDVVRLALGPFQSPSPHIESVEADPGSEPLERVRQLSGERRASFFAGHLDPSPRDVLSARSRSLCLVRPDHLTATIEFEQETGHFDTKLAIAIATGATHEDGTPRYLRSREDIVVTDVYWRALAREWLGDEEFMEVDESELRERLGEIYVVLGLSPKGAPRVLGVHTVPDYQASLDEDAL